MMTDKAFKCSVITPEGQVFDGEVLSAVMPAYDGQIGILFNRAPLMCKLGAGRLALHTEVEEFDWFVAGGFAQVIDNQLTVLTQRAVRVSELSSTDAQAHLDQALKMPGKDEISARRKDQAVTSARAELHLAK
jgi:F-type H+-transporting ATPase subunit epsilon